MYQGREEGFWTERKYFVVHYALAEMHYSIFFSKNVFNAS